MQLQELACSYNSLHAVTVACKQLQSLKVLLCSFLNLFESFVLSSSQELRSACFIFLFFPFLGCKILKGHNDMLREASHNDLIENVKRLIKIKILSFSMKVFTSFSEMYLPIFFKLAVSNSTLHLYLLTSRVQVPIMISILQ